MKQYINRGAAASASFCLPLGQFLKIILHKLLYINERGDLNETKHLFSLYVSFIDSVGIGGK